MLLELNPVVLNIIKILLEVELGVIFAVSVFEAVTYEVDVVVLSVESVAVTTCKTLPVEIAAGKAVTLVIDLIFLLMP